MAVGALEAAGAMGVAVAVVVAMGAVGAAASPSMIKNRKNFVRKSFGREVVEKEGDNQGGNNPPARDNSNKTLLGFGEVGWRLEGRERVEKG